MPKKSNRLGVVGGEEAFEGTVMVFDEEGEDEDLNKKVEKGLGEDDEDLDDLVEKEEDDEDNDDSDENY